MVEIKDELIRAYALKNAVEHEGQAVMGSVLSPLFHEGLKKDEVRSVVPRLKIILGEVNNMTSEEQGQEYEKAKELISRRSEREGLQELPNAKKGEVVTRFAPSPSGPMHIGHAATGMPSSIYADLYEGRFIVRIEDTNPENIYVPAYDMIREEANWLFGNVSEFIIQSERMESYYSYVERFLEKDAVYVCICESEDFRKRIGEMKACPCRGLPKEEQRRRWEKMLDKHGYSQGEAVLRFKSSLDANNPALRDFPLARINETPHPLQKKKYRVWPLMNLSVFVDDLESGVTHNIRAKEHQDNALRQMMMLETLGEAPHETIFMGRYNFVDLEISSSKTKKKIDEGTYKGWDDIRLPFIASLRKRGFKSESFRRMAVQRGVSGVDKKITHDEYFELLSNFNRELIRDEAVKTDYGLEESEGSKKYMLKMPDGSMTELYFEEDDFVDGVIHYFKKIGYARYNEDDKSFWFAHA